jgi:hypothetical protein
MSTASPNSLTAAPRQRVRQNSESLTHLSVMCSIYLHQIVVLHSIQCTWYTQRVAPAGFMRLWNCVSLLILPQRCIAFRVAQELSENCTSAPLQIALLQIACCKSLAANYLLRFTCFRLCTSVSDFPYIEFSTQNPLFLFYLKLVRKVVWCNITGMHQRFSFYAPAVPVLIRCESSHSFRAGDGPRNGRRRPAAVIICAAPMIWQWY